MRWTVRGIEEDVAQAMNLAAQQRGVPIGTLVNEALALWLDEDVLHVERAEVAALRRDCRTMQVLIQDLRDDRRAV